MQKAFRVNPLVKRETNKQTKKKKNGASKTELWVKVTKFEGLSSIPGTYIQKVTRDPSELPPTAHA